MSLVSGRSVLVQFPDDDQPELWQERVLLVKVQKRVWAVASPDAEVDVLDLDDYVTKNMPLDRRMPRGIREGDCYLVYETNTADNFFSPSSMKQLIREARGVVDDYLAEQGEEEEPARGAADGRRRITGKRAIPGPSATADRASRRSDSGAWLAAEKLGDIEIGDPVNEPPFELRRGARALAPLDEGGYIFAKWCAPAEGEALRQTAKGDPVKVPSDARTLAVKMGNLGRHRDFGTLAEECEEESFEDFPLMGPRTVSWCLGFLRKRRSPSDHHILFKTVAKLQPECRGVVEHENLCQMVELAGSYDQDDLTNAAWAEAAFGRIQAIEWSYHEKVKEAESGMGDRLTTDEVSAFSGSSRGSDVLMVAPHLLQHVKN